jgi:hypothetical protein
MVPMPTTVADRVTTAAIFTIRVRKFMVAP